MLLSTGRNKPRNVSVKARTPNKSTLDATHNSKVQYFQELKKNLPDKKRELYQKEKKLDYLNNTPDLNCTEEQIFEKNSLRTEIKTLKNQITDIENNREELDYYLRAGKILFEYYENANRTPKSEPKTILDFLEKKEPQTKNHFSDIGNFVTKTEKFQRADLYEEFLSVINPHYVRIPEQDDRNDAFCSKCQEYRLLNSAEACMICTGCGESVPLILDSDKPNYKDVHVETCFFAYKRMNHFNECLSQFQAKESTEIPNEIYDTILMEMKKERNTNLASLTRKKVRAYLKKHSDKEYNKYYEHIPHIINRLNGIQPKTMTPKMEEELRIMFRQIQEPFERHRPETRKNFLNINYVLHKFCELKGWDDFVTHFPLLKSKDILYMQDKIWKNICADLNWMFIPSR